MKKQNRENRGLHQQAVRWSLPVVSGGPVVFLCFLLTMLHPQHSGPGATVTSALSEICELETVRIELEQILQERDTGADGLRCRGNVTLTSCQGQCRSSVAPSVVSNSGFVKKCTCCKEVEMRSANIQLAHCVTDEGVCLSDYVHEMVIQEPSKCACQACSP